jgi:hypothetical protein
MPSVAALLRSALGADDWLARRKPHNVHYGEVFAYS